MTNMDSANSSIHLIKNVFIYASIAIVISTLTDIHTKCLHT